MLQVLVEQGALSDLPSDGMVRQERIVAVQHAIQRLPADERELIMLRFFSDLNFKDIAAVVRRPLGTVLWKTRQAMQHLARHLKAVGS